MKFYKAEDFIIFFLPDIRFHIVFIEFRIIHLNFNFANQVFILGDKLHLRARKENQQAQQSEQFCWAANNDMSNVLQFNLFYPAKIAKCFVKKRNFEALYLFDDAYFK